ncbi:MAG TPA: response regulator [Ideonella sp.]|nr:response regulator [Ideonella sp.]
MGAQPASLVFGHVELRLAERLLLVDGKPVGLGSRGFDLLRALVSKRDRVVSKSDLLDEVWPGLVVGENNLQVQISGLRRVLGARAIATVAGLGYRFTLAPGPDQGAVAGADDAPPTRPTAAMTAAHVLVADDNKVNRLLLCRSLELMGHRVQSAEDGHQALAMLRQQRFDLLLLDLAMPELDGFGLLQLRAGDAALREVSVIVTSSLGGVAAVARCIELGADDFLHKPVDPWLLKARVDSSLARKQRQDLQAEALRRLLPDSPAQARRLADATVLAARLHGLERMDPPQTPQETMELLSAWCTVIFDVIGCQGGQVAQFSGDGLMALFAEPQAAVRAARDMAEVSVLFNAERATAGQAPVCFGVGIARGPVLVGAASTTRRVAYVCIGEPVSMAETLCAACSRGGHHLLMDGHARAGLDAEMLTSPVQVSPDCIALSIDFR